MEITSSNVKDRLRKYCEQKGMQLIESPALGWGQDGGVYSTNHRTAVKGFKFPEQYRRELEIYERLTERQVSQVEDFAVPRLIDCDPNLAVIEMEVVKPPFVVDFVAAYLDGNSPFSPKELASADRLAKWRFGKDWDKVQSIRAVFRRHGVYLGDLKPDNIKFR